jgi:hypothetical protein
MNQIILDSKQLVFLTSACAGSDTGGRGQRRADRAKQEQINCTHSAEYQKDIIRENQQSINKSNSAMLQTDTYTNNVPGNNRKGFLSADGRIFRNLSDTARMIVRSVEFVMAAVQSIETRRR